MILLNLPLDECKIEGKYTLGYFFYVAMAIATVVFSQKVNTNGDQF